MKKKIFASAALTMCSLSAAALDHIQTKSLTPHVVADSSEGTTYSGGTSSASLSFNKFDTSTGVLLGVTSTYNASSSLTTGGTRERPDRTPEVVGDSKTSFTVTGLGGAYTGANKTNSVRVLGNSSTASWSGSGTVGSLSSYAGSGVVSSSVSLTHQARLSYEDKVNNPRITSTFNLSQTLTYSYLLHSNTSFSSSSDLNSLTLDVTNGENTFSVFNYDPLNRVGFVFTGLECVTGNCDAFSLSSENTVDFLALTAGDYAATYRLNFLDAEGYGAQASYLDLNLTGTIAAVPEPATYAMLGLGLGLLGFAARKKK